MRVFRVALGDGDGDKFSSPREGGGERGRHLRNISRTPSDSSNSSRLTEMGDHEEERRSEEIKRKRDSHGKDPRTFPFVKKAREGPELAIVYESRREEGEEVHPKGGVCKEEGGRVRWKLVGERWRDKEGRKKRRWKEEKKEEEAERRKN